ncbi:hypothetical protein L5D93_16080 [Paenibacillus thiaminolyticus]|nr:hypothetical protein [Paenibacillus thiaminolyticus]
MDAPIITIKLHRKAQPKIMALDKPGNRDEQGRARTDRNGQERGRDGQEPTGTGRDGAGTGQVWAAPGL